MEWKTLSVNASYEVSDTGKIRNRSTKKEVKPFDNGGYDRVGIGDKKYLVHRLVASEFINNPKNLETVNHIDFNKRNNNVSNLEWLSNQDNIKHAVENKEGRKDYLKYEMSKIGKANAYKNSRNTMKPVQQFTKCGELLQTFESARVAERETGVGYKLISAVCKGDKKSAHGFVWKFLESQSTIESMPN